MLGKILGAGTTFLVSLLIARRFGPEGFGDFTKITTYVAFFFLLADFGLNAGYLQKTQADRTQVGWWPSLLGLRLAGSLILVFTALAILSLLPQGQEQGYTPLVRLGIILLAPSIIFQALITSANAIFQQKLRYSLAALAILAGSLVTLILVWWSTARSVSILSSVAAILMGSLITALVALFLARRLEGSGGLSFTGDRLRQLLLPAVPLGLTLVFDLIYFRADSVILTLTRSTSEVGIYGLAYKVFEVPLVIPTFFMNVLYPLLLTRKQEFTRLIRKSLILLLAGGIAAMVASWILAPALTLVRPDFSSSIVPFRILTLGLPFFFLSALALWGLIALGKQWLLLAIYGPAMIINICLNLLLVPTYGYFAAAWITVGSEGLILLVSGSLLLNQLKQNYQGGRP